jgi:hypothetical protein
MDHRQLFELKTDPYLTLSFLLHFLNFINCRHKHIEKSLKKQHSSLLIISIIDYWGIGNNTKDLKTKIGNRLCIIALQSVWH